MKKNILIIDPASKSLGWSWWQYGKLTEHGTILANPNDPVHKRLLTIFNKLNLLFAKIKFDEVHIEQMNTRTHRFCIWSVGMCYTCFGRVGFVADDINVTQWKQHYGLKQKDKGDAIRVVFDRVFPNVVVKSDDEYESIMMGKFVMERKPPQAKPVKRRKKYGK